MSVNMSEYDQTCMKIMFFFPSCYFLSTFRFYHEILSKQLFLLNTIRGTEKIWLQQPCIASLLFAKQAFPKYRRHASRQEDKTNETSSLSTRDAVYIKRNTNVSGVLEAKTNHLAMCSNQPHISCGGGPVGTVSMNAYRKLHRQLNGFWLRKHRTAFA